MHLLIYQKTFPETVPCNQHYSTCHGAWRNKEVIIPVLKKNTEVEIRATACD